MGRRKKQEIDRIRIKMWSRSVANASGLTWYALNKKYFESEFHINEAGILSRPTYWEKQNREGTAPSDHLIDLVTRDYPQTRYWLDHPFWDIAGEDELPLEKVLQWVRFNEPKISISAKSSLTISNHPSLTDSLWKRGDLMSLGTLLALIRLAWHYKDAYLYYDAAQAAMHVLILNLSQSELALVKDELFSHIKLNFLSSSIDDDVILFKGCENISHYIDTLDKSLRILLDQNVILEKPYHKAKASFILRQENIIKKCVSELPYFQDERLTDAIEKVRNSFNRDGRSGKRNMSRIQILKNLEFMRICRNNGTLEESMKCLDWKPVLTQIRPSK